MPEAYEVFDAATNANVFYQNPERLRRIHKTKMICTVIANDCEAGSEAVRWFMTNYQFRSDPWRLYYAASSSGSKALEIFSSNINLKFLLRQVKAADSVVRGEKINGAAATTVRTELTDPRTLTGDDPVLLMLYGHALVSSKSYVAALAYMTRAYALAPEDPMICLSMALAYIHRAMQRLSDNRQWQLVQGLTLLFQYFDRRKEMGIVEEQEANYNVARALHQVGM